MRRFHETLWLIFVQYKARPRVLRGCRADDVGFPEVFTPLSLLVDHYRFANARRRTARLSLA